MEAMTVVVLDGEELPISIYLIQHRFAHQLGSSLPLQKDPVLDHLMLEVCYLAIFPVAGIQYSQVCGRKH